MTAEKRAVEIDDLYEIVLQGDAQISPDGSRIAYVRRQMDREKNDYVSNIWLWAEGANRQYTSSDRDGSPRWSPDGRSLAFISKRDGSPKSRLYVLQSDGGEALPMTEKNWEISSINWAPGGKRIAFVRAVPTDEFGVPKPDDDEEEEDNRGRKNSGEKNDNKARPAKITERLGFKADGVGFVHDRRDHIYVLDVANSDVVQITDGDCNDDSPAWSPDGDHIAFSSDRNPRWDTEIDCQIWEVACTGGTPRRIPAVRGSWTTPVYSPDGKFLACVGMTIGKDTPVTGFAKLWQMDRLSGELTDLTGDDDVEVGNSVITDTKLESQEPFLWNSQGIWFLGAEAGSSNVFRWQGSLNRMTDGLHDIRDFSVAGESLAFTRAALTSPAEVFVQRGAAAAEQVTHANAKYLDQVRLSLPEPITFSGSGGEDVKGWLMKPSEGDAPWPLIVYIHGGPQAAYGNAFFHEMQMLAGHGFGILLINPHGSGSLGEAWVSSIHGDWGNRDFADVMAATDTVAALDWVDERRLGVGGGSYGGYMTSWTIGHTDRFAAAVIERSLVNMLSFVGTTDVPNWWEYAWLSTIEGDPMKLWAMSPIAHLSKMSTPSLVVHSENDHRCPVEQGEQIFTGLRKRGVPTRFVRFPDESHGLSRGGKPSRRVERLQEILSWFERYLKGDQLTKTP